MKQYNIFGEIDHIDNEGNMIRCEICSQPSEADCCSEECSKQWVKLYIEDVWEIKKED